jgi:antitoxin ParD1/3/4
VPDGFTYLYYHSNTMQYAQVSVKFPTELNDEIEQFIEETGLYTNRSEFVKDASRRLLQEYHNDVGIAALRLEQLLEQAERERRSDDELRAELADIRDTIGAQLDPAEVEEAVTESRRQTSERVYGHDLSRRDGDSDADSDDRAATHHDTDTEQ